MLDYWLAKGVDGFRLDVAGTFLHDATLTPNPPVPLAERRRATTGPTPATCSSTWYDSNLEENVETLEVIRRRVEAHIERTAATASCSASSRRRRPAAAPTSRRRRACTRATPSSCCWPASCQASFVTTHFETLADYPDHWPTISFSNHDVPRTVSRFGGDDASPELAKMLFALLISLKGTTLIYQGEELGLPQADLTRDQLRDPVGDLYWPYDGGRDGVPHADALDHRPADGLHRGRALAAARPRTPGPARWRSRARIRTRR